MSNLKVEVKNTNGMNGTITYDNKGKVHYAIHNGKWCVKKTSNMGKQEISDYSGNCTIVVETSANCFTYEPIREYEIVDKDRCIAYFSYGEGTVE